MTYWIISSLCVIFFSKKRFYLFDREHGQGAPQAEGEAGIPLSREPDAGLDPRPWDRDLS